jgi:hypothetical protein
MKKEDVMPEATQKRTTPFVLGPDDGEATWFLGTRMVVKATAQSTVPPAATLSARDSTSWSRVRSWW